MRCNFGNKVGSGVAREGGGEEKSRTPTNNGHDPGHFTRFRESKHKS